ncbi:MAG: hypothetical protein WA895_11710 [Streptosporangiaceae bacterium]
MIALATDIAAEFPAWEITLTPTGMWSAYWESEDRRHRHFIVAPAVGALLQQLRQPGPADQTAGAGHPV